MTNEAGVLDLDDEEILTAEVTDAMLEAACLPQTGGAFTANLCTVMADCGS